MKMFLSVLAEIRISKQKIRKSVNLARVVRISGTGGQEGRLLAKKKDFGPCCAWATQELARGLSSAPATPPLHARGGPGSGSPRPASRPRRGSAGPRPEGPLTRADRKEFGRFLALFLPACDTVVLRFFGLSVILELRGLVAVICPCWLLDCPTPRRPLSADFV